MELVTIDFARVTHFYLTDEVRPAVGLHLPSVSELVGTRYNFARTPKPQDMKDAGAKFEDGRFEFDGGVIHINELVIFNDGMVVASDNTESAEIVLDNVLLWAQQTLGMRPQKTLMPRWYSSGIVVDFDPAILRFVDAFRQTRNLFTEAISELYPYKTEAVGLDRFAITMDPKQVPQHFGPNFVIERRVVAPFNLNRFFCMAQLRTSQMIALAESFEREALALNAVKSN